MTILALLLAALTAVLVPGGLYLAAVESLNSTPDARRNHTHSRSMRSLERPPASRFRPLPDPTR